MRVSGSSFHGCIAHLLVLCYLFWIQSSRSNFHYSFGSAFAAILVPVFTAAIANLTGFIFLNSSIVSLAHHCRRYVI